MSHLVSIAVPVPGLDLLTYRVPAELPLPVRGARVLVPLGTRRVTGCVTAVDISPPDGGERRVASSEVEVRDILDVLDAEPFLPPDVVDLCLWVAEYYASGPGDALAAAMPPLAWVESQRRVRVTDAGRARLEAGGVTGLAGRVLAGLRDGRAVAMPALVAALERARRAESSTAAPARDRPRRPRSVRPPGILAAVSRLAGEGLVEVTQPLTGRMSAFRTARVAALTVEGATLAAAEVAGSSSGAGARGRPVTPKQRHLMQLLSRAPGGIAVSRLAGEGISSEVVRRLAGRGLVSVRQERQERDPFASGSAVLSPPTPTGDSQPALTGEQTAAVEHLSRLVEARRFQSVVLHGVTGSGKTEIYRRLAAQARRSGRGVLMLVPEIGLTPAMVGAFRSAFGNDVAIQHSGLADGERHDQWHRIRSGSVGVVVGTRSAVFAPIQALGLVIVDEEHDGSYKQEEAPRYHGRDVAVMRAKRAHALVVLGSATPSLESHHNALGGRYERVVLSRRVLDRPMATVQIVDMREEYAREGPDLVLSGSLREALSDRLARREQSLVLLNRRGFASVIFCRQCTDGLDCPNCSVSLTVHRAAGRARCHYCDYAVPLPEICARCGGPYLELLGIGTERVEEEIRAHVPGARVARLDRDTVRRRGAMTRRLDAFRRREIDILVGTQMIAKGHDFPDVTLVGVISADVGLGLADFRAAERTFQLLTQVAGRAGRGDRPGVAIVQTLYPGHYSIRHACRQDYESFYAEEIQYRRAMRYPPTVALVNAIVRARTLQAALRDATELRRRVLTGEPPFRVLGPAPAPLSKLRGEHRAQLFLKGRNRAAMRVALVSALSTEPDLRRRVVIDVDPLSVL